MKKMIASCALALLGACSSAPNVRIDSDPAATFSAYHTFRWIQPPDGGSPLLQQRIVAGVNEQLRAKGWSESDDADVAIAAHVATAQRQDVDTFYTGPAYAGWGWRGGAWGAANITTTTRTYDVGTLVVDLFDARSKQAIWRGSASGTVPSSNERINERVQAGIAKMFERFPPHR